MSSSDGKDKPSPSLHKLLKENPNVDEVQALIEKYPDALKEKDDGGYLPLHTAVGSGASVEVMQLLINAHPQAAKERLKDGRLPIEVYLKNENAGDLVLALLKDDMPVSIEDGLPVEHSGSWTICVSSNSRVAKAAVRQVLSFDEGGAGYGKYIHFLADARDSEGRTALGAATSEARTEINKYLLFCRRYKFREGPPEHITGSSTLLRAQDLIENADFGVIFDQADKDKNGNLDKKELNSISIADFLGLDPDLFLKGSDKKTISKAEFVAICKRQLGDGPREVVIKFMRSKDHWERERNARTYYNLNPKYVVSALSNVPTQTEISEAVRRGDGGLKTIVEKFLGGIYPGKYAFFMNAADRNLQQILYQEQPRIDAIRDMLRQVFEAVQNLHDQGLMHDYRLRLIDLDASARIAQVGEVEESFAGAKFSSAILPPEMVERIVTKEELEAFKKYWKAENDESLYEKVKPKPYREQETLKAFYAVKSFRTEGGRPVHKGLPYDLVNASSSIDAWSLGVLAFTLLTGETLLPSTFVDDCSSGAAMHYLYLWGTQPEAMIEVFTKIRDDAARDLVMQLLQYEPGKRPSVASLLKDHPFFNSQSEVVSKSIEEIKTILKDAAKNYQEDRALLEKMDEWPLDEDVHEMDNVQKNSRSQGLLGDQTKGKDLLGVKEEAHAIAETIAFKDLQTPFVVGILGGWGSGKSFTFNLIREHLKEIQEFDLTNVGIKHDFPYVGHFYPIDFSAWTYAKSILWASIMNCILTVLNDQLSLEAAIGPKLLMKGVSVIELMDEFTTSGEIEYLKKAVKEGTLKPESGEWEPRGGNITKALIDATNSNYEKDVKQLEEKKEKLHRYLALEEVTAEKNTKIQPEIKKIFKEAYEQYAKDNPLNPVPLTVEAAMNTLDQRKGVFGRLKRYRDILRAGSLKPLWVTVFLSSFIIAVVLPLVLDKVGAALTALGPVLSSIFVKLHDAREKWMSAKAEIAKLESEMHLDKEQFQKALKAANKAQRRNDELDEEKQQDDIQKLNAEINTLEGRVWLREGDSLDKVVTDRLRSNNYEEHLGIVHQAQKDLKLISDAMLRRDVNEEDDAKKIFPRGDPRIVLFIDDLDRCPPDKVVETLEAVQLLVKTKLFVVVLAIDAQYVTLCLENHYLDILHPERQPSGLDYIEKIIQIPYRVPPISAEYMESYLQEQMNPEEGEEDSHELSADDEVLMTQKESSSSDDDNQSPGQPNAEAPTPTIGQKNSELLEAQINAADDDTREHSAHNVSRLKQEEEVNLNADKDTREIFHGSEFLVEREELSAEGSDKSKSPEPNDDDNQSPGQPNVKTPISHEDMTSETTHTTIIDLLEETSGYKEPMVAIPTKKLKFTRKELQSLKDACVFSGVGPRSGKRLVNVFKLMKIIWYRRDQTPGVDTPHGVSMRAACVLILALCASSSKSVRREMCKVLAKIEKATSMPADCGNLKRFIKNNLGEIESDQIDDSPLTMICGEKCNKIFEKVKWENDKEWNVVKNDLRLVRSFSFVGEYNEPVVIHPHTQTRDAYILSKYRV